MPAPYEATGRIRQKARTRAAVVDAARRLLAHGQTPRVEDAAELAGISRTTAYRYFPTQRALFTAAQPDITPDSLLPEDAPTDPLARLEQFMDAFTGYNFEWETQLRTALRFSLEPSGPARGTDHPVLRQGRAVGWIEDALDPLRRLRPELDVHALAVAIRSATGIEALVWLLDVAGQTPDEAAATVKTTARALLDVALSSDADAAGSGRGQPQPRGT